jgi:hypothetical protein
MKNWIRNWLGINQDMQYVAQDITKIVKISESLNSDVFGIFHALPFAAGILTMKAKDAASFVNPNVMEPNGLYSVLINILIAARQGHSYMQVEDKMSSFVRKNLEQRGFKIEETNGTNDVKGLFVLWT